MFNFNKVENNSYKMDRKNRIANIESYLDNEYLINIENKLNVELLQENIEKIIEQIKLDVGKFKNLDIEDVKLLLQTFYVKQKYFESQFNDEDESENFISLLEELMFWDVELLFNIDNKKFNNLQKFCLKIFNDLKHQQNLTEPFPYRNKQEKGNFDDLKNKIDGDLQDYFNIIEEINRDFIPYNFDEKFHIIFSIIDFPYTNFKNTIKNISDLKDPFVIRDLLQPYISEFEFIEELLLSDSIFMRCYGLYSLNLFLEKLECNYLKNIQEELDNIFLNNRFEEIRKLYKIYENLLEQNEKRLNKTISIFLNTTPQNINITLLFLDKIFRLKNKNYGNQTYLLHSFETLFSVILKTISNYFETIPDTISLFSEHLPISDKNLIIYGSLIWVLNESNNGEEFINHFSQQYFNEYLNELNINESNPNYGFDYEYQHQFLIGLLHIILTDIRRNNKLEFVEIINNKVNYYHELTDNPFNKTLEEYNINLKYEYFLSFVLEIKYQTRITKLIDNINDEVLNNILENYLNESEYYKIKNFNNNGILNKIAQLSLDNRSYANLLSANISTISDLCTAKNFNLDVNKLIIRRIEDSIEFNLANLDTHKLLNNYWCLFAFSSVENILNHLYNNLKEHKNFLNDIHKFRMENNFEGVFQETLKYEPINVYFIKKINLKSIINYLKINRFDITKLHIIENVDHLLS